MTRSHRLTLLKMDFHGGSYLALELRRNSISTELFIMGFKFNSGLISETNITDYESQNISRLYHKITYEIPILNF